MNLLGSTRSKRQYPGAEWGGDFLRTRCQELIFALHGLDRVSDEEEMDMIANWIKLLSVTREWLTPQEVAILEELQILHARVVARLQRGGCEDISPEIDKLVRGTLTSDLAAQTGQAILVLDPNSAYTS